GFGCRARGYLSVDIRANRFHELEVADSKIFGVKLGHLHLIASNRGLTGLRCHRRLWTDRWYIWARSLLLRRKREWIPRQSIESTHTFDRATWPTRSRQAYNIK